MRFEKKPTKDEKIIYEDKIFRLEWVDWRGSRAVKKSTVETTPQTRADRLKNDVYGMQFFADMVKNNPQLNLYVPKVYESGAKYYIREYLDGEPVVSEDTPTAMAAERLDKLARLLAGVDQIKPYGEIRFVGSADYRDIRRSFTKWAEHPLAKGTITQAQVDKVWKLSNTLNPHLQPRIAHGDMSPYKHAYFMNGGRIGLIDFENFSPNDARYFDVAWSYTRLFSFAASTDIPKNFLASFLTHAEKVDHRDEQLLAIFLQRTLAMQYDAYYDAQKGINYRDRAVELLDLVLKGKVELLHSW